MEIKCQNCLNIFLLDDSDLNFYSKINVPKPTFCPQCRLIRRFVWRNEHFLYKKKDENSRELIFSTYPPESKIIIYNHDYWWSDAWDPKSYGRTYDFGSNFFKQFYNLMCSVPWCARSIKNSIYSDYCNNISNLKNAYLCFSGKDGENLAYGFCFSGSSDCIDFYQTKDSRLCYETFSVVDCENVFYSSDLAECFNMWFSDGCRDCHDCFGCVNLRHKKYCIFNKQYTKEDYKEKIANLFSGSYDEVQKFIMQTSEFKNSFPVKYMHSFRNKNTTGDYTYASNNALDCFEIHNVDNARYSQFIRWTKDCYDFTSWGVSSELIYESVNCGDSSQNLKFCFECWPSSHDLEYCIDCHSSSNCFGCVGLKKAEYCILNKQYSKEEYFKLRTEIILHMNRNLYVSGNISYGYGEFFPAEFSPFKYEESSAMDYFPKENINLEKKSKYEIEVKSSDLPQYINDVNESIVGKVISCDNYQKNIHYCVGAFKITKIEFDFYKRFNIPLPHSCPNCRFYKRMEKLNSIKQSRQKCRCDMSTHNHKGQCENEFITNYPINSSKIIFCEYCFQQEVV